MDENKAKALKAALGQIEKQFGKNTIMHLGDESATLDADVVSTGSSRLVSVVCQKVVSLRFTVLKALVKPL